MTTIFIALTLPLLAEGPPRSDGYAPAVHEPPAAEKRDLVSEVRSILLEKCAACHGTQLTRPKGKFGHVDDLKRLASNSDLVAPFRPEDSKLWQLIRDNEMPPKRSKAGPLTAEQKTLLHAWIETGATVNPAAEVSIGDKPAPDTSIEASTEGVESPFLEHFLSWLGKFHIAVVHFPIALLVAAAAGEFWSFWRGVRRPADTVRFCILFAAAGAVAATSLGWLHAAYSAYADSSSQALFFHRWTGTAAGAVAIGAALVSEWDVRRGVRSQLFRVLLFVGALLVGVAAHLGGMLVYGADYFNW
jgi:uncharacterized membrane protein